MVKFHEAAKVSRAGLVGESTQPCHFAAKWGFAALSPRVHNDSVHTQRGSLLPVVLAIMAMHIPVHEREMCACIMSYGAVHSFDYRHKATLLTFLPIQTATKAVW